MKTVVANPAFIAATEHKPSVRWALLSLSLTMLLSSLGTSIANVGLPTLAKAFNASFQDVQWVVIAYLLVITTLIVSVGRLGDLAGRRRLMLAGLLLFTLASALCGMANELWLLIAARVVQGLGAATMMALTMAFVGDIVPKERTGSAMGLLGTMSAIGTALGPSLGGLLIASLGWQSIFFINVPLGILSLWLAYSYLPVDRSASPVDSLGSSMERPCFDHLGTLLLALTLAAYALAVTLGHGTFGLLNLTLLVGAIVGIGLFLWVESKAASPLIRLALFRNSTLSAGFATSTLVAAVIMATLVVGPFYLSGALGLDAIHLGLVMSSGPIVAALVGVPVGRIVDRFGTYRMTMLGLICMLVGTAVFPMMPISIGVLGYIAPLVVMTAGYALFQVANNTSVMGNIRPEQRGVIAGMLNLSRNLGLITGASVMGAVFAFGAGEVSIIAAHSEAVAVGMRITFVVAAVLILFAIVITFAGKVFVKSTASISNK
jgi:EmrB/QacA subfamily drug resistance transporter